MYSVTSEAATNAPFQSAPPRAARSDANSGNGIFGALVDNNTTSDAGNSASTAPPQPAWQSRSDNPPPAANGGSQNAAPPARQPTIIPAIRALPPRHRPARRHQRHAAPPSWRSPAARNPTRQNQPQSYRPATPTGSSTDAAAWRNSRHDGDKRHRDRYPRYRRGDGNRGCSADLRNATAPLAIAAAAIAASLSATAAAPAQASSAVIGAGQDRLRCGGCCPR